jgi:hypothetical protein
VPDGLDEVSAVPGRSRDLERRVEAGHGGAAKLEEVVARLDVLVVLRESGRDDVRLGPAEPLERERRRKPDAGLAIAGEELLEGVDGRRVAGTPDAFRAGTSRAGAAVREQLTEGGEIVRRALRCRARRPAR